MTKLLRTVLAVLVLAGCGGAAFATEPPGPPTSIAANGASLVPPDPAHDEAGVVSPDTPDPVVLHDPATCLTGGEFVRYAGQPGDLDGFVCGRNGPELFTLFPMSNVELVRLVLGPYAPLFISTIIPRETGHTWNPNGMDQGYARKLINSYDCHQWTQLCSKQAQARALGYSWDETNYALPALLITRMLVDYNVAHHKDPYSDWRCGRCSMR